MPKTIKKRKKVEPSDLIKISDNLYVPSDFANNHAYFADPEGKRAYYGVTTILGRIAKPQLIPWAANMACDYIKANAFVINKLPVDVLEKINEQLKTGGYFVNDDVLAQARVAHTKRKEDAGAKGTDAHEMIESVVKNAIEYSDGYITIEGSGLNNQVDTFINWAKEQKVKFLASELKLHSEEWWVAGTADFVCQIGEKLYIGDLKTSRGIYPTYHFQTSAYAKMAIEMGQYEKFDGTLIVHTPEHGGITIQPNFDLEGNTKAFEAALTLHRQLQALGN